MDSPFVFEGVVHNVSYKCLITRVFQHGVWTALVEFPETIRFAIKNAFKTFCFIFLLFSFLATGSEDSGAEA